MDSVTPSLAVVIPTYNRATTIRRAVESVLASGRPDIEVVVVDDLSTDGTAATLSSISDRRLKVLRTEGTRNANRARDLGVRSTAAPVLAFLDSDDEFLPGRVERLVELFAAHPAIDAVVDGLEVVRGQSRRLHALPERRMTGNPLIRLLVCHALPITNSVIAVRRAVYDAIGGFDLTLRRHQDRDILLRIARRHLVAIGTATDVVKHQSSDSFSRKAAGYISGLDDLVARHSVFLEPENREILGYLIARAFIREAVMGRLVSAGKVWVAARKAQHLPFGVAGALTRYSVGRRRRKEVEMELTGGGRLG